MVVESVAHIDQGGEKKTRNGGGKEVLEGEGERRRLEGYAIHFGFKTNMEAKTLALETGLQMCFDKGLMNVHIEMDFGKWFLDSA
ncbi:hypothetical protein ACH5RR_018155 [Cinchona calisaya]|uniref:RNase H type-1 domain-containing protein n=1 Tax=Cinchona calisaya TaxID=153742 RepID=A0ABD2ZKS6_9GENT